MGCDQASAKPARGPGLRPGGRTGAEASHCRTPPSAAPRTCRARARPISEVELNVHNPHGPGLAAHARVVLPPPRRVRPVVHHGVRGLVLRQVDLSLVLAPQVAQRRLRCRGRLFADVGHVQCLASERPLVPLVAFVDVRLHEVHGRLGGGVCLGGGLAAGGLLHDGGQGGLREVLMHAEQMDQLGVPVAHLSNAAEEAVWVGAKLRESSLGGEHAVAPRVPHDAESRVAGHQQPAVDNQRVHAEALEVERQRHEVGAVVRRQANRSRLLALDPRPGDGVEVHGLLAVLLPGLGLAALLPRGPQVLQRLLRGRGQGREVLLAHLRQHLVQPGARLQGLHLLEGRGVRARERVEAGIHLLLRYRHAAPDQGVEVQQLLLQRALVGLEALDAGRQVLLQVQEVAQVLPVVEQVAHQLIQLLLRQRLRRLAARGTTRGHGHVRVRPAQLRDVLHLLLHALQQVLRAQLRDSVAQCREICTALALVLVEEADAQHDPGQLLQLGRLLRPRQGHEGAQAHAREDRLQRCRHLALHRLVLLVPGHAPRPGAPQ
mmetsp:Transcript_28458/g.74418  ORF Transcript_28458/g.74418 Transcript_28458/m.74418 type:complete len:547 (-) Transcript_28458:490-2130(-)